MQLCSCLTAQEILVSTSDAEEMRTLPRHVVQNPLLLVQALTSDQNTEEQNFRAIFTWVATNIRYDWRVFYAADGTGRTDVTRMLRRRSGICLDYATLMDTLCLLAGITNRTIYGYVKDETFDVGDSLYVDNHAWNAVKLAGRWYLYDVTFASGEVTYNYTRFSRFLLKLEEGFPQKFKKKKIRKRFRFFFIDECGNEYRSKDFYLKQRFFNRLFRSLIFRFRLRVKPSLVSKVNMDYYLVNPDLFLITHAPDNPVWSLTSASGIRDFESDSAFYHLESSNYLTQIRNGRACMDCDNELQLVSPEREHNMRLRSFLYNRRNRFITSLCEYDIALYNYKRSEELTDSLPKVMLLDTAMTYLQHAKTNLRTAFRNTDTEFQSQRNKNKRKQMLLLAENREHADFIKSEVNLLNDNRRKMLGLQNRIAVVQRKVQRRRKEIQQFKSNVVPDTKSKFSQKMLDNLHREHDRLAEYTDSVSRSILSLQSHFESLIARLSRTIDGKSPLYDSIMSPIRESTRLRTFLKDNYKKPIVEVRKLIGPLKKKYSYDLHQTLYEPTDSFLVLAYRLLDLVELRYNRQKDLYHSKLLLVRFNQMPFNELAVLRQAMKTESLDMYCWLDKRVPTIRACSYGLTNLRAGQVEGFRLLTKENETERRRTVYIGEELLRHRKKCRRVVVNNMEVVNRTAVIVKKNKRTFLNQLKRERREAARKH